MPPDVIGALCNARDLGGTALAGGGRIRGGVLYRGDAPMPGDRSPTGLPTWPPASVIDLRGARERTLYAEAVRWPATVPVQHIDLMPHLDPSAHTTAGEGVSDDFLIELYMATARRADLLVPVAAAAATLPTPVFVHCSAGKDRTSIAIALLLDVAGAETEAIIADQLASNAALPALRRRYQHAVGPDVPAPVMPPTSEPGLRRALEIWRAHSGGTAGWLASHGLDVQHLDALRTRLRG